MPEWTVTETGATLPAMTTEVELAAEREMNTYLRESFADLERLYREDVGWLRVGAEATKLTPQGRDRIAKLSDLSITGNPLIKRGVALRTGYVWGDGVEVNIRDDGAEGQDVNAVWRAFWDEPSNRTAFSASEAQVRYERKLASRGEAFWALPTNPLTGKVWIRRIPATEIVDRITNPEDAEVVWLYKRVWKAEKVNPATGERTTENRTTYYPALGFYPRSRPKTYAGDEIRWDAPMRPVTVNCPEDDWRGLGDVLAALPWSRMDKEFLEDLAVYMRAMTRILAQVTAKKGPARNAAAEALQAASAQGPGSVAVTDPGTTLSLVSKSGAHIDADSHKPLATMVAAALEVPLTMLLGDPGVSGARAVAETLDQPTENMARLRRSVHDELFRDVAGYVIDQAVIAPRGPLKGKVTKDGDRIVVELPEGDSRKVDVAWPEFDSTPLKDFVTAVAAAEELPPLVKFKLYCKIFGIDEIDDLIDQLTDDDGNWVDPELTAAQTAIDDERRRRAAAGNPAAGLS